LNCLNSAAGGVGLLAMAICLLLLLTAALATAWVALRRDSSVSLGPMSSARGLLDLRLASGEISPEEYFERESALRSSEPPRRWR
jgi:uncharacterized membrane protein